MRKLDYFKKQPLLEAEEEEIKDEEETTEEETDVEETDVDEEDPKEDEPKEEDEEEDEEATNEDEFIDMFLSEGFVSSFKDTIKQYVSENNLDDDFNSFTVLPFVEIQYKDEVYGLNAEFESAVTININDDGKVVESDVPDVDVIKYKTPAMDDLTILENEIGKDTISVFIKKALKEIKNVPR
tara:strand:+ start:4939 stop:5487 length:549 start_codon:yes stop_codon:yes gene_type:complete